MSQIINAIRRFNATIDPYLILALLEIKADNTVFFAGLEQAELIQTLMSYVQVQERNFYLVCLQSPIDEGPCYPGFFEYLVDQPEMNFDIENLKKVYSGIKEKGEKRYEFTRFDFLDEGNAGREKDPGLGKKR